VRVKIKKSILFFIVSLIAFSVAFSSYAANASDGCKWLEPDVSQIGTDKTGTFAMCLGYEGFTNKAVRCITKTTVDAIALFLDSDAIKIYYADLVKMVFMCYIMYFGIRVSLGHINARQLRGSAIWVVLKMALAIYVVEHGAEWYGYLVCSTGDIVDVITKIMSEKLSLSAGCFNKSAAVGQVCVNLNNKSQATGLGINNDGVNVWNYLDCLLGSFISFSPNSVTATPEASIGIGMALPLGLSIFGLIVAGSASGYIGMAMMASGVLAVSLMLLSIMRAAFLFVQSILGLALMFAAVGLFVPFAIFDNKQGLFKQMFNSWVNLIIRFMLEPVFLVAILIMVIKLFDHAIYTGNNSLMRELFQKDEICDTDVQKLNESGLIKLNIFPTMSAMVSSATVNQDPDVKQMDNKFRTKIDNLPEELKDKNNLLNSKLIETLPGLNIAAHPAFNGKAELQDCIKDQECSKGLLNHFLTGLVGSLLQLAFVCYMALAILDNLPTMVTSMVSSISSTSDTIRSIGTPGEGMYYRLRNNMQAKIEKQEAIGPMNKQNWEEFIKQDIPEIGVGMLEPGGFLRSAATQMLKGKTVARPSGPQAPVQPNPKPSSPPPPKGRPS